MQGAVGVTRLMHDDAQQVQRVGVARVVGQQLLVDLRGFWQASGLMMGDGRLQSIVRCGHCTDREATSESG